MTATAPGLRADASSRARALTLAAALLLALSALSALPAALFSSAYYSDSWEVAAAAAPASALPTLVLVAAAVARGSRSLLLVASGVTVLHLAGLLVLAMAAADGPKDPVLFLSGPAELGLALVGLALAWWDTSRAARRPWVALLPVVLAPMLGPLFDVSGIGDPSWLPVIVALLVAQHVPAALTVLAAGLVCLPDRGSQVAGAALIGLAALSLYWPGFRAEGLAPHPLRYVAIALALVCAAIGIAGARPGRPDADGGHDVGASDGGTDGGGVSDREAPAPPPATAALAAPPSGTAAGGMLTIAALAVLVLTVGLNVPELFAHGPSIRPGGAGPAHLIGFLVDASVLAALTLTAGAVTLGSRGVLVVASVCSGLLALVLLVSRTAAGWAVTPHEALPFVALGLSLALAWTGARRHGPGGAALRGAAAIPLVLAASPLMVLTDPSAMAYAGDPTFLDRYVLQDLLPGVAPVVAAALLGFPHRGTRVAAAVLFGVLAVTGVGTVLDELSGLRLLAALNLLRAAGYALAGVLAIAAVLAPRRQGSVVGAIVAPGTAE